MQQQPHSAFSPPLCSEELSPDSSVGQEGKGGEGEPQGEDQSQPEPEPPQQQPQQQEQKPEPQTLPSQPQHEPEPQAEPQPQLEVKPQSEPEPEPSPEPDPPPQDESVTNVTAPQDPPEAPSPCREEKMAVEAENHKSEEIAEAKLRHERDEVQGESGEGKPTQGEEDEEEGGAKGGGAGRRASLHHTASPLRVQRNGAGSHSASSDYELSLDLKNKQVRLSWGWGVCWYVLGRGWIDCVGLCLLYFLWSDSVVWLSF